LGTMQGVQEAWYGTGAPDPNSTAYLVGDLVGFVHQGFILPRQVR
jgi:hypothetical protein